MVLANIFGNKCPNCKQGKIFKEKNQLFNFNRPKMNSNCAYCHFVYSREPRFFFGAMYVIYALTIIEALIVFILSTILFGENQLILKFGIIVGAIALLSFFNLRLSRIIWIYIFSKLDNPH